LTLLFGADEDDEFEAWTIPFLSKQDKDDL
jgi:hypothetical protein